MENAGIREDLDMGGIIRRETGELGRICKGQKES